MSDCPKCRAASDAERDAIGRAASLARENARLRAALKGAEIALARDSDIDGAMRCILSVDSQQDSKVTGETK